MKFLALLSDSVNIKKQGERIVFETKTKKVSLLLSELPRIIDAELRVGLHPLWSALPPRAGSHCPYSYLPTFG
jgi:hypothetical protein